MSARVSKINCWFKHYTNETCPSTFLNKYQSAVKAGYKGKDKNSFRCIGYQNAIKLHDKISAWLDEAGLSETALKLKVVSLLEVEETKIMAIKGTLKKEDLPDNCKLIASSEQEKLNASGDKYTETNNLIGIDLKANEIQRRTLDMAIKIRGMNAPEKHEHTGKIETKLKLDPEELIQEMKKRGLPIPEVD